MSAGRLTQAQAAKLRGLIDAYAAAFARYEQYAGDESQESIELRACERAEHRLRLYISDITLTPNDPSPPARRGRS